MFRGLQRFLVPIGWQAGFLMGVAACTGGRYGKVASPAGPPVVTQNIDSSSVTLTVPDSISGFALADRQAYEDPALGHRLRYLGPDSMYADVFVFPGPPLGSPCDSTLADTAAAYQIAGFREGFPVMIERHYVDSIAVVEDQRMTPQDSFPWCVGRHLTLAVIKEGRPERSDFYLYVLSGYFVKVRFTYPFTAARLDATNRFIDAVFSRLIVK